MMRSKYVFDNAWVQARERLALQESIWDPGSIRHLEQLGVAEGWQCLEVGAGGGSIAAWLCDRVGPSGHVLATDLDTRFLDGLDYSNLEVRRHDIAVETLPDAAFDLIHSRQVLMHLPERDRALRTMIDALKPGGWLLVEETASTSFPPGPPFAEADLFAKVIAARSYVQMSAGADNSYGRRVYGDFRAAGLLEVEGEGRAHVIAAGTPAARIFQLSIAQLRERMVDAGLLNDAEVDRFLDLCDDPSLATMGHVIMAVWGRKPT